MSSINLVIAASIALLLTVLSIRAAPIASPTTEKIEKPSNLKQIPAKLPEQIKNTEARLLNKSPNQPSSKVPAAKPLGGNKVENSAISEKMQQKLKLDLVKPRPDQIRPQPDQVRPQLEQDDQLTSEYSNTEDGYPARNRLLEASYQHQQPQLMDQSLEFGGIAPPSAAANYLILTGDFTGFEKAISDLLSIGMMTEEDAIVYRAEVGQEYDNLMNQLLLEYNGNEQNKPSYEPANTIYDELSSPQLSIPEIVDYPEAAEDDEQQQMQQQQQIQEPQLQNEYLDQLLQNILDASWKDQDSPVRFNPENEETIEGNPETGDSSSDDSSADSNLEEQLQSIADPRLDSSSSNEAKEEMELQQLANDIAQAVKYQQNNDTKDKPKSEQSNDKSTETDSSSAVEKRSQS